MPCYVILTRLSAQSLDGPLREAAQRIGAAVREQFERWPGARWVESFALIGRYDFLDVFELSSDEQAQQLQMVIRAAGPADAEVLPAPRVMRNSQGDLLRPAAGGRMATHNGEPMPDEVEEASMESFPASDAPGWIW